MTPSRETEQALADIQADFNKEQQIKDKAAELAKEMEGSNIKDIAGEAQKRAQELSDALAELNAMNEAEIKKTGSEA